jgi:filamentous hemagglutinin
MSANGSALIQPAHLDKYGRVIAAAYVPAQTVWSGGDSGTSVDVPAYYEPRNSLRYAQYGVTPPPAAAVPLPNATSYGAIAYSTGSPMDGTGTVSYYWPAGSNQAGYDAAMASYNADQAAWQNSAVALNNVISGINAENNRIIDASTSHDNNFTSITGVNQTVTQDQVTSTSPGRITAGGNMTVNGNLNNADSTVVAGGNIAITGGALDNRSTPGTQTTTTSGTAQQYHIYYHGGFSDSYSTDAQGAPAPFSSVATRSIDLGTTVFLPNTNPGGTGYVGANGNNGQNVQTVSHVGEAARPGSGQLPAVTQVPLAGANASGNTIARTEAPSGLLPTSSLYSVNAANGNAPLIATDPAFTHYQSWLSSDYLLSALGLDPAQWTRRMGDGFWEQQQIEQQVAELTGRRYLGDYSSDDAQYRALMNAGDSFANQWGIRPGVALTGAQMAQLTSDIVWLVSESVTLPDGSREQVLVPQLYVVTRAGDLAGSGALIAGNNVNLQLSGDMNTGGTITGRHVVNIAANDINNVGGRITANQVGLTAAQDINVIGAGVDAKDALVARAGRDLNVVTTTSTNRGGDATNGYIDTRLDRVAGLYVTGAGGAAQGSGTVPAGTLIASAGRDINLSGAAITNNATGGTTTLQAGHDLNIKTVATAQQQNIAFDASRHLDLGQSSEVGTQIATAGDLHLAAGNDLAARAASVQAGGNLTASAGHDLAIEAGAATTNLDDAYHYESRSLFGHGSGSTTDSASSSNAISSRFAGNSVALQAGHDLTVTGSEIAAQNGASLLAGNNLTLQAAENSSTESHAMQRSSSGATLTRYASSKDESSSTLSSATHSGSSVTSTAGNIVLAAGLNGASPEQTDQGIVAITASSVRADGGRVAILGNQIVLDTATDTTHATSDASHSSTSFSGWQIGAKRRAASDGSTDTATVQGSSVQGASGVSLAANGLMSATAANLDAGAGKLQIQGATVELAAGLNASQSHQQSTRSKGGIDAIGDLTPGKGVKYKSDGSVDAANTTLAPTTLSGQSIAIESTQGDMILSGVQVANPATPVSIQSAGNLNLAAVQTTSEESSTSKASDLAWQSVSGKGHNEQSTHYNELGGNVTFNVQGQINAQINAQTSVKDSAATLAKEPGMGWIGQLQTDPAISNKVNWQQIQQARDHWDYSAQGLTPAAAAVITIVVAYFTAGAGSSLVGTTTATAAGGTVTTVGGATLATTTAAGVTTTALGAAINAGVSTLASQAAVSLLNNQGDIGKTLKDLGSSESVRSLVASMLTAGVAGEFAGQYNAEALAAKVAAGCASGAITGAGCQHGAEVAGVTGAAGWGYHTLVGYAASPAPGKNPEPGTNPDYPVYKFDRITGQQAPDSQGNNVIGFNQLGSIFSQGGFISKSLNLIPFVNGTAGFHDWLFNSGTVQMNGFTNIVTMLPAAAFSIPAALDNPSWSWITNYKIPTAGTFK